MNPTQCQSYVNCPPGPAYPSLNYNAEVSEVIPFLSISFQPSTPPPLNWSFSQPFAYATGKSTVSQAAADAAAINAATSRAESTWIPPGENPPILPGDNIPASFDSFIDVPPII